MSVCAQCGNEIVGWPVVDTKEDVKIHIGCLYEYSRSLKTNNSEGDTNV